MRLRKFDVHNFVFLLACASLFISACTYSYEVEIREAAGEGFLAPITYNNPSESSVVAAQFKITHSTGLAFNGALPGPVLSDHELLAHSSDKGVVSVIIYSKTNTALTNGIVGYVQFGINSDADEGPKTAGLDSIIMANGEATEVKASKKTPYFSIQNSLSVDGTDSDGDGVSDTLEGLAGTSSTSTNSAPTVASLTKVTKLQFKENFPAKNKGTIKVQFLLPRPSAITGPSSLENASFKILILGQTESFTLDEKLKEVSKKKFKIKGKSKKNKTTKVKEFTEDTLTVDVQLKDLNLVSDLEAVGLSAPSGKEKIETTSPVTIQFGMSGIVWEETVEATVKGNAKGIKGSYKPPKETK